MYYLDKDLFERVKMYIYNIAMIYKISKYLQHCYKRNVDFTC